MKGICDSCIPDFFFKTIEAFIGCKEGGNKEGERASGTADGALYNSQARRCPKALEAQEDCFLEPEQKVRDKL